MEHEAPMDPPPEAAEHPYDSSSVDVTRIRWMLDVIRAERLQVPQSFVDATWKARGARRE